MLKIFLIELKVILLYCTKARKEMVKFNEGDKCTIKIPKIDRQTLQHSRIPGKILRVLPHGYYEVITSAGILKDKYTIENLGLYNGVIETSENLNRRGVATKISLREAAIAFNNHEKNAKIKTKKANDPNVFASKKRGQFHVVANRLKAATKILAANAGLLNNAVILIAILTVEKIYVKMHKNK